MTLATSAALGLADVVTTAWGQSAGVAEGNPVVSYLVATVGFRGWVDAKVAAYGLLWLVVLLVPVPIPPRIRLVVQLANVAMAFVVLSNVGLVVRR